jgi:hypothetical protein
VMKGVALEERAPEYGVERRESGKQLLGLD